MGYRLNRIGRLVCDRERTFGNEVGDLLCFVIVPQASARGQFAEGEWAIVLHQGDEIMVSIGPDDLASRLPADLLAAVWTIVIRAAREYREHLVMYRRFHPDVSIVETAHDVHAELSRDESGVIRFTTQLREEREDEPTDEMIQRLEAGYGRLLNRHMGRYNSKLRS